MAELALVAGVEEKTPRHTQSRQKTSTLLYATRIAAESISFLLGENA
jgi:hypothetical protein